MKLIEMIKNIDNLKRFDFTSECKTCKFKKELGVLEYCCSFVYEIIQEQQLHELKKNILEYVFLDDLFEQIKTENILFSEDDEWSVNLKFKTNLFEEKDIISNELCKALMKSPYFNSIRLNDLKKTNHKYKKSLMTLDKYIVRENFHEVI